MFIQVNWVKEDEELLEPYEWCEFDDLEDLEDLDIFLVDDAVLYDFIYGCLFIKDTRYCSRIFALSNGKVSVIVEIDTRGKLIYRGVSTMDGQRKILCTVNKLDKTMIEYELYDEAMIKEYGLTRQERTKKQYVDDKIDELYVNEFDTFLALCNTLEIHEQDGISKYVTLKKKIEYGYSFIHEMLYYQIIEN